MEPVEESCRVEKARKPSAALEVTVFDGQPAPRRQQVSCHPVGPIPILTHRQASPKTTRDSGSPIPDHICRAGVLTSRMSVLDADFRADIAGRDPACNDKETNQCVHELAGGDILHSSIEDDVVPLVQVRQLLGAFALITIREMLEVGIQVHVLPPEVLRQSDTKPSQDGGECRIRFLHSWMNFMGFRYRDIGIMSRPAIHWSVPATSSGTLIGTDTNEQSVHATCVSKASEMYRRNISPRATCL